MPSLAQTRFAQCAARLDSVFGLATFAFVAVGTGTSQPFTARVDFSPKLDRIPNAALDFGQGGTTLCVLYVSEAIFTAALTAAGHTWDGMAGAVINGENRRYHVSTALMRDDTVEVFCHAFKV